jgi:hypothetical protein
MLPRTVDGNGNALGQSEAILAEEGRDLAQRMSLEVLNGRVGSVSLDDGEVDVVGLRNHLDGGRAGVVLGGGRQELARNSFRKSLRGL